MNYSLLSNSLDEQQTDETKEKRCLIADKDSLEGRRDPIFVTLEQGLNVNH